MSSSMPALLQRAAAAVFLSGCLFGAVLEQPARAAQEAGKKGAVSPYADQQACGELREDSDAFDAEARAHRFDPKEELDADSRAAIDRIHNDREKDASAAPNAAAQAMLGMLAGQMASRGDRNSQVAAEWYKSMGITPGTSDAGLAAIGCGSR